VAVVDVAGGAIEYEVIGDGGPAAPLVFLHEGLGSVELWRRFPAEVAAATGRTAAVYSRHGYGHSSVVTTPRRPDYMHREADVVLPDLLALLGLDRPVLVGHSDGASIALLYAGAGSPVTGLVLLAPHVFVEDRSVAGIAAAREAYRTTGLAEAMRRYHTDGDATFRGWNDVWLSPGFRDWNIEDRLPGIDCPVLLVAGEDDQYGTPAQLDAIERGVRGPVERLLLPGVGHAPHLEAPDETTKSVVSFITRLDRPMG
jgi:pimeloyl-ACP methyl ester carboxylesterase